MRYIDQYDLFLFDFDGLLVNTEWFHYRAYQNMCKGRGHILDWDFPRYIEAAHYSSEGLKEEIYKRFPSLKKEEPDWSALYREKHRALLDLYREEPIALMEGVEELLGELKARGKKRCVVTHSDRESVAMIRKKNPTLDTIPNWIVREDYKLPKPAPDGYLKAIELLADKSDRIIGFEDSPKGLKALLGSKAKAVMVTSLYYPEIEEFRAKKIPIFPSFTAMSSL